MAMTPDMDTARIEHTTRVIEYEEDKPKIKRFIEDPLEDPDTEPAVPTDWDLIFRRISRATQEFETSVLGYGPRIGIVFSPSDHNGIWAGRLEGVKG